MIEHDDNYYEAGLEEAHYYWILNEICDMIRQYGYSKVLMDIDKALRTDDLEVELKSKFEDDMQEGSSVL